MSLDIMAANIRIDGEHVPKADFEILLRFVCDFIILVDGIEVFRDVEFPFVEFASQVAAWLRAGGRGDFDFESMDSAVRGLVYFHRTDEAEWKVGSMLPGTRSASTVANVDLRRGVDSFLASVPAAVDGFGVDVRRFIDWGSRDKPN